MSCKMCEYRDECPARLRAMRGGCKLHDEIEKKGVLK